jgi:hypothetical protein
VTSGPLHRAAGTLRHLFWGLRRPRHFAYRRRILIAGQPKSGTTALYFLVKAALPFAASSFEPPRPLEALRPGTRPYLVKHLLRQGSEEPLDQLLPRFERRILLLRDPRDRLVSLLLYDLYNRPLLDDPLRRAALVGLLRRKEDNPAAVPLLDLVAWIVREGGLDSPREVLWRAQQMAELAPRLAATAHLLRYEDLVAGRLAATQDYLGLPLRPAPAATRTQRRVLRTGAAGDWRNWCTDADVDWLRPRLAPLLARLGYGDDWSLARPARLDPRHGSDYVLRLSAERAADRARLAREAAVPAGAAR